MISEAIALLLQGVYGGLRGGLVSGAVIGLVEGVIGGIHSVICVETIKWSWRGAVKGLGVGLVFGLFFGLGSLLLLVELGEALNAELLLILLLGVVFGLVVGLIGGFRSADMQSKTRPNEGIRQSEKNAMIVGLGSCLVIVSVVGLVAGTAGELLAGLGVGLLVGLVVALVVGLTQGGKAVILHYILRAILTRTGRLPWRLVRFLNHCVDRILLRRVGGGYIFIHRLLQEHFALLDLNHTLEVDPQNIQAYSNRGSISYAMQQYGSALSDFTRVLELDSHGKSAAIAHYHIALIRAMQSSDER